jgi:hypothetical protein
MQISHTDAVDNGSGGPSGLDSHRWLRVDATETMTVKCCLSNSGDEANHKYHQ